MNNPYLANLQNRLGFLIFLALTLLLPTCFSETLFVSAPNMLRSGMQALYILAVWYPIKNYRTVLSVPLFLLFHVLLLLVVVGIWWGEGLLIVFEGLMYIISVLGYYLFLVAAEVREQKERAEALSNAALPIEKLTRISVKKQQELFFIPVSQLLYIEANGDYVLIHTADGKFLKDRTMKYWETHLPDDFVRIHRSFILNITQIAKIELYEKETYTVQMKNGKSIRASAAGYKLLKQKLGL